ncbi:Appr-1'-p processing enzyme [Mactra antiquata]
MATQLTSAVLGKANIEVFIMKGDLSADESDVIVCTTTKNLALARGRISKSILDSAGHEMLKDCARKYPRGIQYNEIAAVYGGNLRCKEVYFIALPVWGSGIDEEKVLKTTIMECLHQANKSEHSCIAFPALGTGLLRYPTDMVAKATFKCIEDFSNKHGMKATLKNVNVIIFYKDTEALQTFESEAMSRNGTNGLGGAKPKKMNYLGVRSIITRQISNGNEDMPSFGNIEVHIESGNYLDTIADVIVSTIKPGSDLTDGDLSKRILKRAGSSIQEEFKKNYSYGVRQGDIAVTKGYKLKCKQIYHGSLHRWDKDKTAITKMNLCKLVCKCLKQAEKDKMKCIAFPPLGTGEFDFPFEIAARTMMNCIKKHQQSYSEEFPNEILIIVDESSVDWKKIKEIYEDELNKSTNPDENNSEEDQNNTMYFLLEMAAKNSLERNMLPPRGTKDWYRHLCKTMPRAPSYWSIYTSVKTLKDWWLESNNIPSRVPVDHETLMAVKKVVADTWEKKHVGQGRDAHGLNTLNYSDIQVTKVERIENCDLFEKYALKRQELFQKATKNGAFPSLSSIPDSSGKILTTASVPEDSALNKDIYDEINEHYMFHGTQKDVADNIVTQGLDCRLGGSAAMFGQGVYAAESSTKADQYADPKTHRTNDEKQMFLIRMCLGRICVEKNARTLARAPCMQCKEDKCSCLNNEFYDSVVADGSWNFREFIVYDRTQVYPEYLITYIRV